MSFYAFFANAGTSQASSVQTLLVASFSLSVHITLPFIDVVLKYNYIAPIMKVFNNEVMSFSPCVF